MVVAALAVGAFGADDAAAAPEHTPTLVFERHIGARKPEPAALLVQLEEILETHGFAARPASVRALLGERAPLPGVSDAGKSATDIARGVDAGFHAYVLGNFDEAVTTLRKALDQIERNPGLIVNDTKNVDMMTRANMALALSLSRLGRAAESTAAMTELIRVTRGQPISRSEYGPEADKLYRAVLKEVQALGRANLTITAGDDRAMIFVDGSLRGMGKATLGDLIPGTYQIFVQLPGTTGRRYSIDVTPEQDHFLALNSGIEAALTIDDAWTGFLFANDAEASHEAHDAAALASMWTGDGMVAVIGESAVQGKAVIIGTLYRTDGSTVRSASIEMEGADRERLRSLARFLADGTPHDGLAVLSSEHAPAVSPRAPTTPDRPLWPKLVVAAGVAALAAGITLYAIDEDPNPVGPQRPEYLDTAPAGVAVGAVGLAVAGVGVWYWLRGSRHQESGAPTIAVGRASGSLSWTFAF